MTDAEQPEGLRLFFAIDIPNNARAQISRVVNGMKTACRFVDAHPKWVVPENLHITLAFLGLVPLSHVEAAASVLEPVLVNQKPFDLGIDGLTYFPPKVRDPKVLSTGITGDITALKSLQSRLVEQLKTKTLFVDDRPFRAHLTLARLGSTKTAARLEPVVKSHAPMLNSKFKVDKLVLFESKLTKQGAVYTVVKDLEFSA